MFSATTYALSKKYTDEAIIDQQEIVIDEAVEEAVRQSKAYTDDRISVATFHIQIVDDLPREDIDEKCIYFVPDLPAPQETDSYYEYIYIENKWEIIGHTKLDLSDYWTIEQVKAYVKEKEYHLTPATYEELGGVIVDINTMMVDENGKISLKTISEQDIQNLFS